MHWITIIIDEYFVHIYFFNSELGYFTEAENRGINIGSIYSAVKHKPHTNPGQSHLHIYKRGKQLFAINKDGTAHDKSHQVRIPNKVAIGLKNNFPDWNIPKDNFIESADELIDMSLQILLD